MVEIEVRLKLNGVTVARIGGDATVPLTWHAGSLPIIDGAIILTALEIKPTTRAIAR